MKIKSLATGRGRFGLAFDWFMPYVTGGAAMVNGLNNLTMSIGGTSASFMPLSHTTLGWTAGAGVEVALWRNWSAKLEYLYVSANGATKFAPIPSVLGIGNASTPGDYRDNIVRVGFNYQFGPLGGPGVLESPLPARAAFAWNGDVLPNLNFAIDRSNTQVAAAGLARSSDQAPAKRVAAHDVAVRSAPSASEASAPIATQTTPRQATPRQVASAVSDLPVIADDDVIYTDAIVTETKPVRQMAKKRPEREEDESARMRRIMSICSGCWATTSLPPTFGRFGSLSWTWPRGHSSARSSSHGARKSTKSQFMALAVHREIGERLPSLHPDQRGQLRRRIVDLVAEIAGEGRNRSARRTDDFQG